MAEDLTAPVAKCAQCAEPAKYRCPGCNIRSCSLPCVSRHKVEEQCSGKRNVSAFCAVKEFDDGHLLADYSFLEGVGRSVDSAERGRRHVSSEADRNNGLTPARRELLRQAQWRGVWLELLPHGMQRQRQNSSRFDHRRKRICWRVELVFAEAGVRHSVPSVPEGCQLLTLLRSLLEADYDESLEQHTEPPAADRGEAAPTGALPAAPSPRRRANDGQRALLQHKLRSYVRCGAAELFVFLHVEKRRADDPRYYRLPLSATLSELLADKLVIEFPTLHIATAHDVATFPLLAADGVGSSPLDR